MPESGHEASQGAQAGSTAEKAADLCLVYLAWGPYGIQPAEKFIASYREHPAGVDHRLILAMGGAPAMPGSSAMLESSAPGDWAPWRHVFAGVVHDELELGEGIDLDNYREVVERVEARSYCFVNSDSEVLADGWLGHLNRALSSEGVGMVATTGSHESPNAVRPWLLRKLRPGYDSFPNPHLRTNGFALERSLLYELDWPTGLTKLEAVALEAGSASLTCQVRSRGLQTLVIGRGGSVYPPERWRDSATFRSGGQANLLLADKRTRHYQRAGPLTRRALAWLAWHRWD